VNIFIYFARLLTQRHIAQFGPPLFCPDLLGELTALQRSPDSLARFGGNEAREIRTPELDLKDGARAGYGGEGTGKREEWVKERANGDGKGSGGDRGRGRNREKERYNPLDNSPMLAGLISGVGGARRQRNSQSAASNTANR